MAAPQGFCVAQCGIERGLRFS
ncbi:MAG: hypothetical protein RLZZ186_228, partial [Cyanobacteriota bacterium]